MLWGQRILLGVSGGIAAYKAAELVRRLKERGADVRVVMTRHAGEFVRPLTFQVLSGHPVALDMFDPEREAEMEHITLARQADLLLIAPATANIIAKLAHGLGDDLLSTLCLVCRCPLLVAPAMNDWMYTNAAVQINLKTLRQRGIGVIEPESGRLACDASGPGRLPGPEAIIARIEEALGIAEDLRGMRVAITAGPTREAIDPVRFISNPSSGRMGLALARQALLRGAEVTLVLGPVDAAVPPGIRLVRVTNAAAMAEAALEAARTADIFIAAAAVSDYTPAAPATRKLKKSARDLSLRLKPTLDILATVGGWKKRPFLVGFAAETGNPVAEARRKLKVKKADLMVANDVTRDGSGFGTETNEVHLVDAAGVESLPLLPKDEVAARILDRAQRMRALRVRAT